MDTILYIIFIVIISILGLTIIYRIIPFKEHKDRKPKFVILPKYYAKYEKPTNEIETSLLMNGFTKKDNGRYSRGYAIGDFSAKSIQLSVDINEQTKKIYIYASFFGVLFDNGDIWQITYDILETL